MASELNIRELAKGFVSLNLGDEDSVTPTLTDTEASRASPYDTPPLVNPMIPGVFRKFSVLIAEDAKFNIAIIKRFKSDTFTASLVENGEEAVKMAKDWKFDLIITDYQMPVMNGSEAAAKIREFDPKIPIFVQSDTPFEELKVAFKGININGFLGKLNNVNQVHNITKSLNIQGN